MLISPDIKLNEILKLIDENLLRKIDANHEQLDSSKIIESFNKTHPNINLREHLYFSFKLSFSPLDALAISNDLKIYLLKLDTYFCSGNLMNWYQGIKTLKSYGYLDTDNQMMDIVKIFYNIDPVLFKQLWLENTNK